MLRKAAVSAFLVVLWCGQALGGITSSSMNVSTYVYKTLAASPLAVSTLSLTTSVLNFGNLKYGAGVKLANATISTDVPLGIVYKVSISAGAHYSAGARKIASGSSNVAYWLFQDSARTTEWGDSDLANTYPGGSSLLRVGTGSTQTWTVYGKVSPPPLYAAEGTHTDILTITVSY